jgi:uncharacterized OsmC-like protein
MNKPLLEYAISARRIDGHEGEALCKNARIAIGIDPAGNADAFNPAELLLASVAACMLKGIERITPILKFRLEGVDIRVQGRRQDDPPRMISISYEIAVASDESDQRLELLHYNVRRYGTVINTLAALTELKGSLVRQGRGRGAGVMRP